MSWKHVILRTITIAIFYKSRIPVIFWELDNLGNQYCILFLSPDLLQLNYDTKRELLGSMARDKYDNFVWSFFVI